ncbi:MULTISPECIES: hypothetical protein [Halobacillus]|uniref:Uncharacterized protein n=1 Tax=Halobacillus aidingensis TaxID=240303 RepID=A0A1H0KHL7_HALAD|nr:MULTISPECIES: hypothetical protein [Halobacillus]SDO55395.1 hypothetical protein SAMN05421677_10624 [Halobacillus aidingensis]
MGDLIPFNPTGRKELDDVILEFLMHREKMSNAKSRAEMEYHYNMALWVLEEARSKRED